MRNVVKNWFPWNRLGAGKSEKLTFRTGYGFLLAVGTPGVAWKGFQDFTGSLIRSVKHIRLLGRNCAESRNCMGR